jgi:hypothetical protein
MFSNKQQATLLKIFQRPTRSDISWQEAKALLNAIGATIKEGRGSRVMAVKDGKILRLHKPHPQKEMKKYAVERVRDYLKILEITPKMTDRDHE